jgi:hypothetical protein
LDLQNAQRPGDPVALILWSFLRLAWYPDLAREIPNSWKAVPNGFDDIVEKRDYTPVSNF